MESLHPFFDALSGWNIAKHFNMHVSIGFFRISTKIIIRKVRCTRVSIQSWLNPITNGRITHLTLTQQTMAQTDGHLTLNAEKSISIMKANDQTGEQNVMKMKMKRKKIFFLLKI